MLTKPAAFSPLEPETVERLRKGHGRFPQL